MWRLRRRARCPFDLDQFVERGEKVLLADHRGAQAGVQEAKAVEDRLPLFLQVERVRDWVGLTLLLPSSTSPCRP